MVDDATRAQQGSLPAGNSTNQTNNTTSPKQSAHARGAGQGKCGECDARGSIVVEGPIGLPPIDNRELGLGGLGPRMEHVINDAMPLLEMQPCFQEFSKGLEIFRLKQGFDEAAPHTRKSYVEELQDFYNVTLADSAVSCKYLKFAFLNVNPPAESFTNDFEESIFSGLADTGSKGLRQLAFATGTRNLGEASKKLEGLASSFGEAGKGLAGVLGGARNQFTELSKQQNLQGAATRMVSLAASAATGRIDFPKFWSSSGWDPSYNINIRLYNPFPHDKVATEKYIVGPLAALLMFVVPRSTDGYTYHWPWLCRFRVPGLFNVQAGYVRSIQVIKGGDDNSIAMNQRPGIVDVKMELGVLYKSMVSIANEGLTERPALARWLEQFSCSKNWADGRKSEIGDPTNNNKLTPQGPAWADNPGSGVGISVGSDLDNNELSDYNASMPEKFAARKVFNESARDTGRPTDTDFRSRVQQASTPRETKFQSRVQQASTTPGSNFDQLEILNNLSENDQAVQDLIAATDEATQAGIDSAATQS
jgi:hypothetical protein